MNNLQIMNFMSGIKMGVVMLFVFCLLGAIQSGNAYLMTVSIFIAIFILLPIFNIACIEKEHRRY